MKIVTIVGARPRFIKAPWLSRAIQKHNRETNSKIREVMVHAGQYLFGSYARGREKELSDIDLVILLERDVLSAQNDLRTTYLIDLARILRKDLHIGIMNSAGEGILAQIFKHGKCIFQRNPRTLAGFRTASYSLIAEFGYLRATMEKAIVSRILGRAE